MADIDGRLSSPSPYLEDFEDEALDPRIQDELERLNRASEEINRLELELDDARAAFRQTLTDSTYKLDTLAKKLGSCVDKARPYYDARVRTKEVHVETQKAAYMFERACSMHEAAKEMVQLAEQGYVQREDSSDPAWQEMLNHATMKVNDAEKERLESEQEHLRTTHKFKEAEDHVQRLQKDLKRTINKSKPYFEMKAKVNQLMEDRKKTVGNLEQSVAETKKSYSDALRNLEEISEAIHQKRLEMRNEAELGIRGAGVGSESPSPPPMRGKEHVAIDGKSVHLVSSCNNGDSPTTDTAAQFSVSDASSREFTPPSVIYSSPEKARSESYRRAIEAQTSAHLSLDHISEEMSVNLEDEFMSLPSGSSPRSYETDTDNVFHGSSGKVRGNTQYDIKQGKQGESASYVASEKKPAKLKLKGLILTPVGAGCDPLQANLRIQTKPHVAQARSEPQRPASYPYSHNVERTSRVAPLSRDSSQDDKNEVLTPGSDKSARKLLKVPSVQDFDEGSISDTESVVSAAMLDDDQVEFLTMDFSSQRLEEVAEEDDHVAYRRLSLPDALQYARSISHEEDQYTMKADAPVMADDVPVIMDDAPVIMDDAPVMADDAPEEDLDSQDNNHDITSGAPAPIVDTANNCE